MKHRFRKMSFLMVFAIAFGCRPARQVELPTAPAPPPQEQDPPVVEETNHEMTTFPLTDGED